MASNPRFSAKSLRTGRAPILSVMEYADQAFNQMRDALNMMDQGGSP